MEGGTEWHLPRTDDWGPIGLWHGRVARQRTICSLAFLKVVLQISHCYDALHVVYSNDHSTILKLPYPNQHNACTRQLT